MTEEVGLLNKPESTPNGELVCSSVCEAITKGSIQSIAWLFSHWRSSDHP